jgi:hypothetical protein
MRQTKLNTKKIVEFLVRIILNSISGMHRSLLHPLATVRHRIGAGPEKKNKLVPVL